MAFLIFLICLYPGCLFFSEVTYPISFATSFSVLFCMYKSLYNVYVKVQDGQESCNVQNSVSLGWPIFEGPFFAKELNAKTGGDLLADEEITVLKKYKVWGKKKFMGREFMGINRTTFLIDKKGKIIKIWENVKVKDHAKEVLETLKIFTKK